MKKKLFRNGPYADFFSQAVQTGNILTLAGQLGDDLEGNVPTDLQGQMVTCFKNIENVLKEFTLSGSGLTLINSSGSTPSAALLTKSNDKG